jgi:hypothetical protein
MGSLFSSNKQSLTNQPPTNQPLTPIYNNTAPYDSLNKHTFEKTGETCIIKPIKSTLQMKTASFCSIRNILSMTFTDEKEIRAKNKLKTKVPFAINMSLDITTNLILKEKYVLTIRRITDEGFYLCGKRITFEDYVEYLQKNKENEQYLDKVMFVLDDEAYLSYIMLVPVYE